VEFLREKYEEKSKVNVPEELKRYKSRYKGHYLAQLASGIGARC
jgi:hypothetical protein